MQVDVEQRDDVLVVRVTGSIDGLTSPDLQRALDEQVAAGQTRIVAAFDQVNYTSSAGLRVLLGTVKAVRARSGDFRLAGVRDDVRRVLELSGFLTIIKVFPDVEAAVASFAS
jgi:anti-sigma B factor antagonist